MPDLNIRNLDAGLMAAVKLAAVEQRVTLREYVAGVLAQAVKLGSAPARVERLAVSRVVAQVAQVRDVAAEVAEEASRGHPSQTCRVYRCMQCQALGVKNPQRGL